MSEILLSHFQGSIFDVEAWFVEKFHKMPNSIIINCHTEGMKLAYEELYRKIVKTFPEFQYWYTKISPLNENEELNEDDMFAIDTIISTDDDFCFYGACESKHAFISFTNNNFYLYFIEEYFADEFKKKCIPLIKEAFYKPNDSTKVSLITYDSRRYYLSDCKILNAVVDIDTNYNDDFKPIYNDIVDFLNNPKSGLILLHGLPGTGKTYFIRHLINNFNKKFIIVTNAMMNSMCDPAFLAFILEHKNSILILEDCEQLLKDRSENQFTNGIANILNMTDGLYSDILNIKFICTFNSQETIIDPALMRKGRLVAKYNFDILSLEKTNNLLNKLGKPESDKPMLLSEIYNLDTVSYESKPKTKVIGYSKKN